MMDVLCWSDTEDTTIRGAVFGSGLLSGPDIASFFVVLKFYKLHTSDQLQHFYHHFLVSVLSMNSIGQV